MVDYQKKLVEGLNKYFGEEHDFVFVYFTKTLQHAKGIVVSTSLDFLIEVVYNGDKDEIYIITYTQQKNETVKI